MKFIDWFKNKKQLIDENAKIKKGKENIESKFNQMLEDLDEIKSKYINLLEQKSEKFDLIVVNNRLIAINNSARSKFHRKDFEGIAVYETGEDTLATFLFLMNLLPRSEPDMDKNIMKIYLQDTPGYKLITFDDLNSKLSAIDMPQGTAD